MTLRRVPRYTCLLIVGILLASCGSNDVRDSAPESGSASIPNLPGDAVPRKDKAAHRHLRQSKRPDVHRDADSHSETEHDRQAHAAGQGRARRAKG